MIYLDTSSFLKIFLPDPETQAVRSLIAAENEAIISSLTELESLVQLLGMRLGGRLTNSEYRSFLQRLEQLKSSEPFVVRHVPAGTFAAALRQHRRDQSIHCRSLDRLHLAAMEEMGISRLMTNDQSQAVTARALGYTVIVPE